MTDEQTGDGDVPTLADRLRQLRTTRFDRPLTQSEVGTALGLSVPTISSWESSRAPKLPRPPTLRELATLYAAERTISARGVAVLPDDELSPEERRGRDTLLAELLALRNTTLGRADAEADEEPFDLWRMPAGEPVTIICGALADEDQPPFAADDARNRIDLFGFADADAAVELFGHLRMVNPESRVELRRADRLRDDDYQAHLVLLGNMAWEQHYGGAFLPAGLPIRPVRDDDVPDGEVFEVIDGEQRFRPVLNDTGHVTEDVGLFLRTRSKLNRDRTLTICSGVYTRGGYGAVRALTDVALRRPNTAALVELAKDQPTFGLLMRVVTFGRRVITPDLRDEGNHLLAFTLPS